jgi:hypothetical protein
MVRPHAYRFDGIEPVFDQRVQLERALGSRLSVNACRKRDLELYILDDVRAVRASDLPREDEWR